jgi:FkbM family methyltransferase
MSQARRWPELIAAARHVRPFLALTSEYLGVASMQYPMDIATRGARLHLEEEEDTKIFWNIFIRECYEVRASDRVIVDAGANVGTFAIYAAWRAPLAKIISVEPLPSTFQRLREQIERNNLADRVATLNYALAGTPGVRSFADERVPSGQKRLVSQANEFARPGQEVQCTTLEAILDQQRADEVDLLKMDIEGTEYEALTQTPIPTLSRIKRIVVELHQNPNTSTYTYDDLADHLLKAGLRRTEMQMDENGFGLATFCR